MRRDLWRAGALLAFLAGLWCLVYGRTSIAAWQTPILYEGDAVSFLGYLKAARDGHVVPVAATFVPDLNAPFGANWNDYPRPQKTFFWFAGLVARAAGLFPTANLLLLGAHLLAGLAFFGVARYLRCRAAWAVAGALAFACSPYIWYRNVGHLALSLYWHIPLDVLVVGWCFRRHGLPFRSRRFAFALLVAFATALFNVYYAAMFMQLLALSALGQALRGTWRKAAAPLVLAGAVVALFALESLGTLQYPLKHGRNLYAVHRAYGALEHYALKPVELILPPPGRGLFHYGALAAGYFQNARGEVGSAYLGVAALAGVLSLLSGPLLGLVRGRRVLYPPALGALVWIGAFSIAGGANGVLGSLGVVLFRGTNRYSIWIAAVALLHLVGRLSRRRQSTRPAILSATLFAAVALLDQVPGIAHPGSLASQAHGPQMDRSFAAWLEAAFPGRPMVFMLPVLDFPESGPIKQMRDYEHFRPYLFTSRVRYSYGTDKGRAGEQWQRRVEAMVPAKMIDRLEAYGFSAIVVDRRGLADGGVALLQGLAGAGRPVILDEAGGSRAVVRLQPRMPARLPDRAPRFGEGWYGRLREEGLWARASEAHLIFYNDSSTPESVALSFELTAAKPCAVSLTQAGHVVATWRPHPTVSVADLRVALPPGESHLVLTTDLAPALTEVGNRLRMATFAVKDLEMIEE